jgi:hypothetical protein
MGLKQLLFVPLFFFTCSPVNAEPPSSYNLLVEPNSILGKNIRVPKGFNYKIIAGDTKQAEPVTRPDMNVLSPDEKFLYTTHEIFDKKSYKHTPSLSRTELATGKRTILITGLYAADGLKWTPWNTLLLGQEFSGGHIYEVNPENGHHIKRSRLGMFAHEGIAITQNGIVYMTDDHKQGAIYKFIPDNPLAVNSLQSGSLYALSQTGWIKIDTPANARQDSINKKATLFKRPEDMEMGPDGKIYVAISGENRVICIDDTGTKPIITDYVSADTDILYPDNLAFHPNGDLYILQDIPKYLQYLKMRTNGIWVARPDKNNDNHSDNIKLFASWAPANSEPSGAVFSHDGHTMYINRLENDTDITGAILKITGFNN